MRKRRKSVRKPAKDWVKIMHLINAEYGTNFKSLEDVKLFQRENGLKDDGKIGKDTLAEIKNGNYDNGWEGLVVPAGHVGDQAFEEYRSFGDLPLTAQQDLLNNRYLLIGSNYGNEVSPDFDVTTGQYLFNTNTNSLVTRHPYLVNEEEYEALLLRTYDQQLRAKYLEDNAYLIWLVQLGVNKGIIPQEALTGEYLITYDQLMKTANAVPIPTLFKDHKSYKNFWHMVDLNNANAVEATAATIVWSALLGIPGLAETSLTVPTLSSLGASIATPYIADLAWSATHNGESQTLAFYDMLVDKGLTVGNSPYGLYWAGNLLHTGESLVGGGLTSLGFKYAPQLASGVRNTVDLFRGFGDPYEMGALGEIAGLPRMSGTSGVTNTGRYVEAGQMLEPGEMVVRLGEITPADVYAGGQRSGFGWLAQGSTKGTAGRGGNTQGRNGYLVTSGSYGSAQRGVTPHAEKDFVPMSTSGPKVPKIGDLPIDLVPVDDSYLAAYGYGNLPYPVFTLNIPPEIEELTHLEELSDDTLPFIKWFGEMRKTGKTGTVLYYPGDNLGTKWSKPNYILIVTGGKSDPVLGVKKFGSNTAPDVGKVAPEMTEYTTKDKKEYDTPLVTVELGSLPAGTKLSETEYITGYPKNKFGGKLVKKPKYLY